MQYFKYIPLDSDVHMIQIMMRDIAKRSKLLHSRVVSSKGTLSIYIYIAQAQALDEIWGSLCAGLKVQIQKPQNRLQVLSEAKAHQAGRLYLVPQGRGDPA